MTTVAPPPGSWKTKEGVTIVPYRMQAEINVDSFSEAKAYVEEKTGVHVPDNVVEACRSYAASCANFEEVCKYADRVRRAGGVNVAVAEAVKCREYFKYRKELFLEEYGNEEGFVVQKIVGPVDSKLSEESVRVPVVEVSSHASTKEVAGSQEAVGQLFLKDVAGGLEMGVLDPDKSVYARERALDVDVGKLQDKEYVKGLLDYVGSHQEAVYFRIRFIGGMNVNVGLMQPYLESIRRYGFSDNPDFGHALDKFCQLTKFKVVDHNGVIECIDDSVEANVFVFVVLVVFCAMLKVLACKIREVYVKYKNKPGDEPWFGEGSVISKIRKGYVRYKGGAEAQGLLDEEGVVADYSAT